MSVHFASVGSDSKFGVTVLFTKCTKYSPLNSHPVRITLRLSLSNLQRGNDARSTGARKSMSPLGMIPAALLLNPTLTFSICSYNVLISCRVNVSVFMRPPDDIAITGERLW